MLGHIQMHLDDAISPSDLAEVACFAPHHFHRVFKGMIGETIMEHIRRLRLERAAWRLKFTDQAITQIAFDACYETHEAFSRAFRKRFDDSPTGFREAHRSLEFPPAPNAVHYSPDTPLPALDHPSASAPVEIRECEPRRVVFVRHVGPYEQCLVAWDTLMEWAAPRGLIAPGAEMLGICHDDPDVTPADKIRYDACLTFNGSVETSGEIGVTTIPGGEYAVQRFVGPYEQLEDAYALLFGRMLPQIGREPSMEPCVEKYWNDPETTPADELETDVCVLLK